MFKGKRRILVLVEGARTDLRLMMKLFRIYDIDSKYKIISYNTNIYTLYKEMFAEKDPRVLDLIQILKARETNPEKRKIFDITYTDILLVFDFEPHAPDFSPEKIRRMSEHFIESSDMGKLYLNYPMVEAFYHMSKIPDEHYDNRFATLKELYTGMYKRRVNRENRNQDYTKFAIDKAECSIVISQNINKAWKIINSDKTSNLPPKQTHILMSQLDFYVEEQKTAVLCTCPFFIPDYNPNLILREEI